VKVGVLASGNLGFQMLSKILPIHDVKFVLTDRNSQVIMTLCKANEIPYFTGNPRNGRGHAFVESIEVDVIVSINYLYMIEKDIIHHSNWLTFNVHGSLLPKYRGRTPHVWAIINNEKVTGITAHIIDEGCDTGAIISQIEVPIGLDETGAEILSKFELKYFDIILDVFKKISSGNTELVKQDEQRATYFGKRTPKDGRINWNWQKERIYNWVRAQAFPYPGAYTYVNNQQLIIDKVEECSHGYRWDTKNGTVLAVNPYIVVKTANGALQIEKSRLKVIVKTGDILI